MRLRHFAGVACLLGAGSLGAQEPSARPLPPSAPWLVLGTSPDLIFSLDTSRAVKEPSALAVWLRFDYAVDQTTPETPGGPYRRTVLLERLKCASQEVLDVKMQLFAASGDQLVDFDWPEPAWKPIRGDPMQTYYEMVCQAVKNA